MVYSYKYNRTLVSYSKKNRRVQTDAEKKIWLHIRNRQVKGYKFRRQYPIQNYILDFYCVEVRLAVEVDGSQHISRNVYDEIRSEELKKFGITVIRFWDNDVLQNINEVKEQIAEAFTILSDKKPHPNPLLRGEGSSAF